MRAERRRAERQQRRERRRRGDPAGQPSMLWLSAIALVIGIVGVIGFALLNRPPGPSATLVEPTTRTPTVLANGLALGGAEAPVTVEVWSDFQCPFCKRFTDDVEPLLITDYVSTGQIRLVYRDMAFLGRGNYDESLQAALAARCAARDDLFWSYHDYLFANQSGENRGAFAPAVLEAIAEAIGIDLIEFRSCMADPPIAAEVANTQQAADDAGIASTPTLTINGAPVANPFDYAALQQQIDLALVPSPRP